MNPLEADLYKRICEFDLDESGATFPFSHKLARAYQWKRVYTLRAIQEYKKFMFLGMVCDHIVSPPVPIGLVWHLHLIYTHSYWDKFCGEVLNFRCLLFLLPLLLVALPLILTIELQKLI
jgi:hypothetical protein